MITVRPAIDSDTPSIASIYIDALQNAAWISSLRPELLDFEKVTEGERVFVAEGSKLGNVGFVSVWQPDCFVHHLYVAAPMRRRGVGKLLLGSLVDWLPRPWTLKCSTMNTSALSFYQSLSWTIAGEGENEDGTYFLLRYSAL
ncbi:MAG: GNAT family N-acetyltransferase [Rhodopirellula sp. JB044]|uniref:GNAT family N-acetyltransferase n=1 Tax=Rhodopirellula sp. JB044 TaxID=3342844 RepID=UPI00370B1D6E